MSKIEHDEIQDRLLGHETDENPVEENVIVIDDAIDLCGVGTFHHVGLYTVGLAFMAESMEINLLSFLAATLRDEWELTHAQAATITALVFVGQLIGALIWGRLGDEHGRRPVFLAAAVVICVAGAGTALVGDYVSLLVARFMVGVGVGGLTVPFDVYAEFLPKDVRGEYLNKMFYFWPAGSAFAALFAFSTLSDNEVKHWRMFVFLCALPSFFSAILCWFFIPESPRWLLSQGRGVEAMDILKKIARWNRKDGVFKDGLRLKDTHETETSSYAVLLSPKWRRLNLLLWAVQFADGVSFDGLMFAITRVFQKSSVSSTVSFDFNAIFVSTLAEFVGVFVASFTVDRVGRIPSLVAFYWLSGIAATGLLFADPTDTSTRSMRLQIAYAFVARCFELNANCVLWITNAEVLPTEIRVTGHCIASAVHRVGAVVTSYAVEGDTTLHQIGYMMIFVHAVEVFCSALLPETKGKDMGFVP